MQHFRIMSKEDQWSKVAAMGDHARLALKPRMETNGDTQRANLPTSVSDR